MMDLGEIEAAQILVFGGAYGNLQATQALFDAAKRLDIFSNHVFCTGDMVAYCAQPLETVRFIRDWGVHCIQGNCEESLAREANDCGCGFEAGSACDVLSQQWFSFCQNALDDEARAWFGSLPKGFIFRYGGQQFRVVHGGVRDISAFIFESMDDPFFEDEFALAGADCILARHCGLPFTKIMGGQCWHNAGVIGMPANDGTPRVWYSLVSVEEGTVSFEHRSLSYDHVGAHDAMKSSSMADAYSDALLSGLWPSLDTLPEHEVAQTGVALIEKKFCWV